MKDPIQNMGRERIWSLSYASDEASEQSVACLSSALDISTVTARLLYQRGYTTPEVAKTFLSRSTQSWIDPMAMKDMDKAVARVLLAIKNREKIAIYGDYDVDGVTSVTSLYLYLTSLGAQVISYIPNRLREGYGMSAMGVESLAEQGVSLIVTVDTGITAGKEVAYAASLGVDTVVTDHHECHGDLPECAAVVNPHRPDCTYPFKELAGVGVVFKLICACEATRLGLSPMQALAHVQNTYIDLVAIGTVADVMPLRDENRYIVSAGLTLLEHTDRPGLVALLDAISNSHNTKPSGQAKKPRRKVNTGLVGFGIAPRINAAGRIDHAMRAVELLLATNAEDAVKLAEELCEINVRRQNEENHIAEQAFAQIEAELAQSPTTPRILVLEDDSWTQGIVGIVASRITEKYGYPSILISFEGAVDGDPTPDDIGKGSGRSVKGMNLVDALYACKDLLLRFGGHELAAGLTLRRDAIPAFRERINAYAKEHLTSEMTAVRYEADCQVAMQELSMSLAEELEKLEPFGVSNPSPVFYMADVTVQKIIPLGGGKHTKLVLASGNETMTALWFGVTPEQLPVEIGDRTDVLFQLNINEYQGTCSLQMILQDMRVSQNYTEACRREEQRLADVLSGAPIHPAENITPTRDDIARVYTLLRGDARLGHHTFEDRRLLGRINADGAEAIGYIKMQLSLRILHQLGVCHIQEPQRGTFTFDVNFSAPKTCIESSPLFRQLKGQMIGQGS